MDNKVRICKKFEKGKIPITFWQSVAKDSLQYAVCTVKVIGLISIFKLATTHRSCPKVLRVSP